MTGYTKSSSTDFGIVALKVDSGGDLEAAKVIGEAGNLKEDYGYDVSYFSDNVYVCGSMYSADKGLNAVVIKLSADDLSEVWYGAFKGSTAD